MKIAGNILSALSMLFICIAILVSCIQLLAFDDSFYTNQHKELGTAEMMRTSENDLDAMMKTLLGYLKGTRPDIDIQVTVDGRQRAAFDERETQHMVDVLDLYNGAKLVRSLLFIAATVMVGILFYLIHKGKMEFTAQMRGFAKWLGLGTLAIVLLVLFAYFNFDTFWTNFHELFFTNDLWLLNPNISLMINMLPSELFFALCMRIAFGYLIATGTMIAVCLLLAAFVSYRQKKGVNYNKQWFRIQRETPKID